LRPPTAVPALDSHFARIISRRAVGAHEADGTVDPRVFKIGIGVQTGRVQFIANLPHYPAAAALETEPLEQLPAGGAGRLA
jgi:hypothetical protein